MSGQPNNMKSLLQIMRDSLVQKNILLQAIEQKSKEQEAIVKKENFTFKEIDENMDAKAILIDKLMLLDNGFETLYEKIRKELLADKDSFKAEIKEIQSLIADVMARGASIEAIEARNKAAIEGYFNREKKELQNRKSASLAAYSYYKTAKNIENIPPQFMDHKN